MQRRTTSFGLAIVGAGLTAHGDIGMGMFFVGTGLFGLWHSSGETCLSHMLAYTRQKVEKRFPLTG